MNIITLHANHLTGVDPSLLPLVLEVTDLNIQQESSRDVNGLNVTNTMISARVTSMPRFMYSTEASKPKKITVLEQVQKDLDSTIELHLMAIADILEEQGDYALAEGYRSLIALKAHPKLRGDGHYFWAPIAGGIPPSLDEVNVYLDVAGGLPWDVYCSPLVTADPPKNKKKKDRWGREARYPIGFLHKREAYHAAATAYIGYHAMVRGQKR